MADALHIVCPHCDGITAAMCAPWTGADGVDPTDVKSFRAPIERFADSVIAHVR